MARSTAAQTEPPPAICAVDMKPIVMAVLGTPSITVLGGAVSVILKARARIGLQIDQPAGRTHFRLDPRTYLSENGAVKSAEFPRRVQKLAQHKKVSCQFVADKGKGPMVAA